MPLAAPRLEPEVRPDFIVTPSPLAASSASVGGVSAASLARTMGMMLHAANNARSRGVVAPVARSGMMLHFTYQIRLHREHGQDFFGMHTVSRASRLLNCGPSRLFCS